MTTNGKGHVATQKERDFIAGLAVFFSMSYAPFVIPVLLPSVNFSVVCLAAGLASIAAGKYAGVPTAMAPGIALAATVGQFISKKGAHLEEALVVCLFAGCILLLTTLQGIRRAVVDAIPDTIKLALAGGIGALLAENALKLLHTEKSHGYAVLFIIGLLFITAGYIVLRSVALRIVVRSATQRAKYCGRFLDLIGRSTLFLSVPLIAALAYAYFPNAIEKVPSGEWFVVANANFGRLAADAPVYLILLIFVVWILHADIVGSPYFRALEDVHFKTANLTSDSTKTIQKSFEVHSVANIFAPALGAPPLVFYAENAVSRMLGGRGALVAYVAGACFLGMTLVGVSLKWANWPLESLIPQIAVAPVLFFVGLIIIAQTLADSPSPVQGRTGTGSGEKPVGTIVSIQSLDSEDVLKLWKNMPAAIAIVVTPVAGFDVGVSFAVLSHYLFSIMNFAEDSATAQNAPQPQDIARKLTASLLILMAFASLALKL